MGVVYYTRYLYAYCCIMYTILSILKPINSGTASHKRLKKKISITIALYKGQNTYCLLLGNHQNIVSPKNRVKKDRNSYSILCCKKGNLEQKKSKMSKIFLLFLNLCFSWCLKTHLASKVHLGIKAIQAIK